jgi:hypothetical protein
MRRQSLIAAGSIVSLFAFLLLVSALTAAAPLKQVAARGADHPGNGGGGDQDEDSDDEGPEPVAFAEFFDDDPRLDPQAVVSGDAAARLSWQADAPAFPGDAPGSLTAHYDSNLPAGWFGFHLPGSFTADDSFAAAAVFVIDSTGFSADPNGFFQISWGLWNAAHTGLDRTGSPSSFAADTFELVEFDYFPNVSPFFGGPFLGPSVFGVDVSGDAYANFTSLFGLQLNLPLDVPLLALIEHRPDVDALVVSVYRVVDAQHVVPLDGAVGVVPLQFLAQRQYELDTLGLTLWHDGFGGPSPALKATVRFHALAAMSGLPARPESLLAIDAGSNDD